MKYHSHQHITRSELDIVCKAHPAPPTTCMYVQEVGWVKFPSLQHLSWAAQWLEYRQGLSRRLEEDKDTLVVPIFEDEVW